MTTLGRGREEQGDVRLWEVSEGLLLPVLVLSVA